MKRGTVETSVGVFVLIGLICVGYLTIKLGKMEWVSSDTYSVVAKFSSISGLKEGALVEIAGVQVGKVDSITLDREDMTAVVSIRVQNNIELDDETIASVRTSGLIGDKYIRLEPGGGFEMLSEGDRIVETQAAIDMEEMVGKYVFGDAE